MSYSILIADDNSAVRSLLVRLVKRANPQVQIIDVDTGQGALDAYHQQHPTLVLLDHGLPDMDGFSVLLQLKKQTAAPYVIMITGDTSLKQTALDWGADEVWLKPMDVNSLLSHFAKLLVSA